MSQVSNTPYLSHDAYRLVEEQSSTKHEYYRGTLFAMAGGTPEHTLVGTNITTLLNNLLASRPCIVLNSDASIYVEVTDLVTYPDAAIVCGPVARHAQLIHSILNPVLIVEVLSPSTEAYDRGAKFSHYKRIESFKEYLLVATDRRCVDHFVRESDGTWRATEFSGIDAIVPLLSVGASNAFLALRDIYAKMNLITSAGNPGEISPRPPGVGGR